MTVPRISLGTWTLPSGNSCDVFFLQHEPRGLEHVAFEWDEPPPFAAADEAYYLDVILPQLHQRLAEVLELPAAPAVYIRVEAAS